MIHLYETWGGEIPSGYALAEGHEDVMSASEMREFLESRYPKISWRHEPREKSERDFETGLVIHKTVARYWPEGIGDATVSGFFDQLIGEECS